MNTTAPVTGIRSTTEERLARLRKARSFSQTVLGELFGVSRRVMTCYERQSERQPVHLLRRLAKVLNVSPDELLRRRPTRGKPAAGSGR